MKTARETAHELAAGIVPSCYSINFDDGYGSTVEHSHHCDFLTETIEADRREVRAVALREAESALALLAVRQDGRAKMSTKDALMCGADLLGVMAERAERGE